MPSIDQIANAIESALHELLPYRPELLAVETGRYLVAESAVLVGRGVVVARAPQRVAPLVDRLLGLLRPL